MLSGGPHHLLGLPDQAHGAFHKEGEGRHHGALGILSQTDQGRLLDQDRRHEEVLTAETLAERRTQYPHDVPLDKDKLLWVLPLEKEL